MLRAIISMAVMLKKILPARLKLMHFHRLASRLRDRELERESQLQLQSLLEGSFAERWEAVKRLPVEHPAIEAQLIDLTQSADPELVGFAIRALERSPSPKAVCALVEQLEHPDEEVGLLAAQALGNIGTAAVEALVTELSQADLPVAKRELIGRSLAYIAHPSVLSPLLSLAQDPAPSLRATALAALHQFDDPRILSLYWTAIDDVHGSVRREAAIGLGLLATRYYQNPHRSALSASQLNELANRLRPLLWDLDAGICEQAAIALSRAGNESAIQALATCLCSTATPEPLQRQCLRALGWIGTPAALAALWQGLVQHDRVTLWQTGIQILGRVRSADTQPVAWQLLQAASTRAIAQLPTIQQSLLLSLRWLRQTYTNPELEAKLQELQQNPAISGSPTA